MHISSLQPQLAGAALEVEFSNLDIVVQCTSLNIHNQRRLFNTSCGEASQFAGRVAGWAGCSRWAEGSAQCCQQSFPHYACVLSCARISSLTVFRLDIYTYVHSIYTVSILSTQCPQYGNREFYSSPPPPLAGFPQSQAPHLK